MGSRSGQISEASLVYRVSSWTTKASQRSCTQGLLFQFSSSNGNLHSLCHYHWKTESTSTLPKKLRICSWTINNMSERNPKNSVLKSAFNLSIFSYFWGLKNTTEPLWTWSSNTSGENARLLQRSHKILGFFDFSILGYIK